MNAAALDAVMAQWLRTGAKAGTVRAATYRDHCSRNSRRVAPLQHPWEMLTRRFLFAAALLLTQSSGSSFATGSGFGQRFESVVIEGGGGMKFLIATATSLGMLNAAVAADLPHPQPPPPQPVIGKAPIGKMPIGKAPIGKYPIGKTPAPVVTKG